MPESPLTPTTAIAIHAYLPRPGISHRLIHLPPALKGLPSTIGALFWPFFRAPLDNWQFQDKNRHDELLVVATSAITILQEVRHFFQNPPLMLQTG
jgi:hypothetical protein